MKCKSIQDQLAEYLGQRELPDHLAAHVASCAKCAEVWNDLKAVSDCLGSDRDFYPEPHEAELVAEVVEREIRVATHVTPIVRPHWWTKVAGVAAAAVIVIGAVSLTWRYTRHTEPVTTTGSSIQIADTSVYESADESVELSSDVVQLLLQDVSAGGSGEASEQLLKDMSDEEVAYIRNSLKAGDLL